MDKKQQLEQALMEMVDDADRAGDMQGMLDALSDAEVLEALMNQIYESEFKELVEELYIDIEEQFGTAKKVAEAILDSAASEWLHINRTLEGIEQYAQGALGICLNSEEIHAVKRIIDDRLSL